MSDARAFIAAWSIPIPFVGCWLWLRAISSSGYGSLNVPGLDRSAHRLSHIAFKGAIPPGALIQHSCDNRWCVNPDHLSIGTHATNNRDALLKGRTSRKLGPDDVRAIRAELRAGARLRALATKYGVHWTMVRVIREGKAWAHIEDVKESA
jgi:hypothetical protein